MLEKLQNQLVTEGMKVLEGYKNGAFSGSGIEMAVAANNAVATSQFAFNGNYGRLMTNMNRQIKSLKFEGNGDSRYLRGAGDLAHMFINGGLLEDTEIFTNNPRLLKHEEACVIRFPHSNSGEFIRVKILGFNDYKSKVLACEELTMEDKRDIIMVARDLPEAVFWCSGSSVFKGLTGGSDFDTDGFMFFVGEDVELFDKWVSRSVDIPDDKGEATNVKFSNFAELMLGVLQASLATGNTDVGRFCVTTSVCNSILQTKNEKALSWIAKNARRLGQSTNKEYVRRFDDNSSFIEMSRVRNNVIEEMYNDFITSAITHEDVIAFLADVLASAPATIGMIIDSAKTGLKVFDPVTDLLDGIKQKRRGMPPKIVLDTDGNFAVSENYLTSARNAKGGK